VQLEDVLSDCDVVVMQDGAAGNLAFRALHLVAGMPSFGAPVLGLPFDLVDTSRARTSFEDPVRLAAFLAGAVKGP
jgi:predicted methyltransferase MtxX (methanogen marker protein 4)